MIVDGLRDLHWRTIGKNLAAACHGFSGQNRGNGFAPGHPGRELMLSKFSTRFMVFSRSLILHPQVVVLMMSVCFIAFVTMLHAVSKIYQYTSK